MTASDQFPGTEAASFIQRGEEHARRSQLNEAIECYEHARKLDPENPTVAERLKFLYRKRDTQRVLAIMSSDPVDSSDKIIQAGGATEHVISGGIKPSTAGWVSKQQQKKAGAERRIHYRMPTELDVFFRPLTAADKSGGKTINVSAGGLLLVVDKPLNSGTFLELRFENMSEDGKPILAVGKVVRVDEVKKDDKIYYGLGIRFTNIKENDRVKILDRIQQANK